MNNKFASQYLTTCILYRMTDAEPFYVGQTEEGDIAFYGLILQSEHDPELMQYLLDSAKDGLWEYQHGYGVTSADSAFVIEGLLEHGHPKELILKSLRKLVDIYFCREEGGFKTVTKGRAAYWKGTSPETTAQIAYLLHRVAPDDFKNEIEICSESISKQQNVHGYWVGKWYTSYMIPTYFSVRLLNLFGGKFKTALDKAALALVGTQLRNGSWNNSTIETSAALLCLSALNSHEKIVDKGKNWLRAKKKQDGWEGEHVLYYWFEDGENKLFHSCRDKGKVTTAWAKLALKA